MKIVHARVDDRFGGPEYFILSLLKALRDRKSEWESVVVPIAGPGELSKRCAREGFRVESIPMNGYLDRQAHRAAREILGDLKPDLVCTYGTRSDHVAGNAAADLGLPWIARVPKPETEYTSLVRFLVATATRPRTWGIGGEYRNPLKAAVVQWADDRALRRASALLALYGDGERALEERFRVPVHRIPNGVDLDPPLTEQTRRDFGLPEDRLIVGTAGRLVPVKGHDVLLEAIERLHPERLPVHYVIAGEGPEHDNLRKEIFRRNLTNTVHFVGFMVDVPSFLNCLDVFVLPSRAEGQPFTLLQAMAAGLPSVSTKVGGIPEMIRHEKDGLLVNRDDAGALADALRLLLTDEARRKTMGAAARQRAELEFSLGRMVDRYLDLYERVAGGRN